MSSNHSGSGQTWKAIVAISVIVGIIASLITVYLFVAGFLGSARVGVASGPIWRTVSSPNPGSGDNDLLGVTALAPDDIWAVGSSTNNEEGSQVLIEHWNGSAWTTYTGPNAGTGDGLSGVAALAPNDIWAVGDCSTGTLVEHWNGANWAIVPSPSVGADYNGLSDVAALAPNNVWAVGAYETGDPGNYDTNALIEHWDGVHWVIVPSPSTGSNVTLSRIAALTSDDIWAIGGPFIEHWNGSTWMVTAPPDEGDEAELSGLAVLAPNNVWAVGASGYNTSTSDIISNRTLIEHWDGAKWGLSSSPYAGSNASLSDIAALAPNDIWAIGSVSNDGNTFDSLAEHWDGTAWHLVTTTNPGPVFNALTSLTTVRPDAVWAVGNYISSGFIRTLVLSLSQ